jgi:hypothetical protein
MYIRFEIALTRSTLLEELTLPFATAVRVVRGSVSAYRKSVGFDYARSASFSIPACVHLDVKIAPDASGAAVVTMLMLEDQIELTGEPLSVRLRKAMSQAPALRKVSHVLAAAAFVDPDSRWSVGRIASMADTTPRKLQERLLKEGGCVTEIVGQQIRQRRFLDYLTRDATERLLPAFLPEADRAGFL